MNDDSGVSSAARAVIEDDAVIPRYGAGPGCRGGMTAGLAPGCDDAGPVVRQSERESEARSSHPTLAPSARGPDANRKG